MGTMSASDAAPLPRLGEVFFDVRGDSRTMRVSWYADTGVAVFSIWQGDTCTGTFRLPIPELPRMVEALTQGPPGRAGSGSRTGDPGLGQADAGAPTAAMRPGGMPVPLPGQPADDYPPPYRDHEETPLDRGRTNPLSAGSPGFRAGRRLPGPTDRARPGLASAAWLRWPARRVRHDDANWLPGRSADCRVHRSRSGWLPGTAARRPAPDAGGRLLPGTGAARSPRPAARGLLPGIRAGEPP